MGNNIDPKSTARAAKLKYVKASQPGFTRVADANGFKYFDLDGKEIKDEETLSRIRSLVLPPAWQDVWICPWDNGHLQATGIDTKGRKQYRYHPQWIKERSQTKYHRLAMFGERLPMIRKRINEDLHLPTLSKDKVIAIALCVMEETLIRVGNVSYERLYGSFGLTTLKNNHVKIQGNQAFFNFKGKKGVKHHITLKDPALIRLLKKVREIPGQVLFQYYDEEGQHTRLDSGEVNEYIRACCRDEDFTCKDFRTWAGTVHALNLLAEILPYGSITECRRNIVGIIDTVANKLGNTRAVCKKYYIHPKIFEVYENGQLEPWLKKLRAKNKKPANGNGGLHEDEKILLAFLKEMEKI